MLTCHALRHYSLKYKSFSFNHKATRLVNDNFISFFRCNPTLIDYNDIRFQLPFNHIIRGKQYYMKKRKVLSSARQKLLADTIRTLAGQGRFYEEKEAMQHGCTTIYQHSVHVAYVSLFLMEKWHLPMDEDSLARGALLHDYFLYDWHVSDASHRLHGFHHPKTALQNASRDYDLNQREQNMIVRHMFPLTPIPPMCREAWLVCLADKWCATKETIKPFFRRRKIPGD